MAELVSSMTDSSQFVNGIISYKNGTHSVHLGKKFRLAGFFYLKASTKVFGGKHF